MIIFFSKIYVNKPASLTRMAFFSCSASARNWSSSFMMTLDLRGRRYRGPEKIKINQKEQKIIFKTLRSKQ